MKRLSTALVSWGIFLLAAACGGTEPATRPTSAPGEEQVRYLGLGEQEEKKVEGGPLRGIATVTKVEEVTAAQFREMAHKCRDCEFHGRWVYFAVDEGLHVPIAGAKAGQADGAWVDQTRRYRADLGRQPAGVPARGAGKLTDGPAMMELVAAIAVRLPQGWFIEDVTAGAAGGLAVEVRKWASTAEEFLHGQYERAVVQLKAGDAARPLAEVVKAVNATRVELPTGSASRPATRPADTLTLLEKPAADREVIVGRLEVHWIHKHIDGPGHGFYEAGELTDRRTKRLGKFQMFSVYTPFAVARTLGVPELGSDRGDVVAVKTLWNNTHHEFQMLVPVGVFDPNHRDNK